jgi:fucokinase
MTWDLVLVTARTAQQRWLFERYLGRLWPAPGTSGEPDWRVVQDPPGPQLGTAGATVHALAVAVGRLRERSRAARVLVLHCGGLSQRVPQLSHVGKAFAPGRGSEADATVFLQVVRELDRLFRDAEPGAVVACGDVLYSAPRLTSPCRRDGVVALAYPTRAEQASRHGVYLWETGEEQASAAWQKPNPARLAAVGAELSWGMDTGILYLGAAVVEALLAAIGGLPAADPAAAFLKGSREWRGLDLYRDLTPPMTRCWRAEDCLPGAPGAAQRALSRYPMRVACPGEAELFHFGTCQELLRLLDSGAPRVHASYVAAGDLAAGVVLDRCLAEQPITVGAGSYVSGLNSPEGELWIAPGRVVYQMPLRGRRGGPREEACVGLGAVDDARRHLADGATLLGEPLSVWLRELGVAPEEVWEGVPERERCLWKARLFPVAEAGRVTGALPWLREPEGAAFGERVDRWRRTQHVSMGEAQRRFDARRWWAHEERIRAYRFAAELAAAVQRGDGHAIGRLLQVPGTSAAARALAEQRLQALGQTEVASLTGARAWLVASRLTTPGRAPTLRQHGFRTLGHTLVSCQGTGGQELSWRLEPRAWVEARLPVRVDLAGGWTDTPPQACERGGAVLNLALLLDGERPLAARVERLAEPVVELAATDLGVRRRLVENPPADQPLDPRDPFSLHLASLRLLGLVSSTPLRQHLERLGGGLRLTTRASVPKGSGLGTSSILGAAVLAALHRAFGLPASREELCLRVLRLEQLMGTGGGWQDQVGGMWGGAKFAVSAPGIDQCPQVEPLALCPKVEARLVERMVVFYTGEPRLARDVLQRVVGRYLVGDAASLAALAEMPALAVQARDALLQGDWEELGRCLSRSWELNRQLEPTCSNANLDSLFLLIAPYVRGAKLAGAGGGGFLFALARNGAAREALEARLAATPPPARLYRATLDAEGLCLSSGKSS